MMIRVFWELIYNMQIARFSPQVWKDLESLRDYAKANVISNEEMEAVAAGAADPSAANPQHQRLIPGVYRVVFSIHDWADGTMMRMLTIQHLNEVPAFEIFIFLMPFFEFTAGIGSPKIKALQSQDAMIVMEMYEKV